MNLPSEPANPKPRTYGRYFAFVAICVFGAYCGMQLGGWIKSQKLLNSDETKAGWVLAALLPSVFLVILVHELGHLLGGKLAGFRFLLLIVGPLKVMRAARGVRIGWNGNLALMGGLAASLPLTIGPAFNRQMAVMVAAGPMASLALACVCGIMTYACRLHNPTWGLIFATMAIMSLLIAVATLIPGRTSGFMTDGAQLLSLLRGEHSGRERACLAILQAKSMTGVRPREWDTRILEQLILNPTVSMMSVAAHVMCYAAALDSGNVDDAARHLESFLKHKDVYPRGFREALVLEAAYFEARHRNRPIVAREYLEASRSAISERHSRFRAEAAVLAAEGKVEESREKAREGLACAGKSWDPGGARAEIDQLKELLDAQA